MKTDLDQSFIVSVPAQGRPKRWRRRAIGLGAVHNGEKLPLQLLRDGILLTYAQAKDYAQAACTHPEARRHAIGRMYSISGGTKWLERRQVEKICRQENERAAQLVTA